MESVIVGLLVIVIVLLVLNLFRSRAVPKVVQHEEETPPVIFVDRPYYSNYPLYSYGIAPWYGWGGGYWPSGYGSGGYSGGIRTGGGGGGHGGGGGGGHGGGGH
jgi:uncharacterized membrane protein YgcG